MSSSVFKTFLHLQSFLSPKNVRPSGGFSYIIHWVIFISFYQSVSPRSGIFFGNPRSPCNAFPRIPSILLPLSSSAGRGRKVNLAVNWALIRGGGTLISAFLVRSCKKKGPGATLWFCLPLFFRLNRPRSGRDFFERLGFFWHNWRSAILLLECINPYPWIPLLFPEGK